MGIQGVGLIDGCIDRWVQLPAPLSNIRTHCGPPLIKSAHRRQPKQNQNRELLVEESPAHPEGAVPGGGAQSGAVRGHSHSADAVLVAKENRDAISLQNVPGVNGVVIITREQQPACGSEEVSQIKRKWKNWRDNAFVQWKKSFPRN